MLLNFYFTTMLMMLKKLTFKRKHILKELDLCVAEDIPFFLEVLTYDDNIPDNKSAAFAKVKPRKVNEAMKLFSEERFNVDVLKLKYL